MNVFRRPKITSIWTTTPPTISATGLLDWRILNALLPVCLALVAAIVSPTAWAQPKRQDRGGQSTLADLLLGGSDLSSSAAGQGAVPDFDSPPVEVDEQRNAAVGIRKMSGKYVDIYTDLPKSTAIDQLPRVFDLAVPMYAKYFDVQPSRLKDWKLTGFFMDAKGKFEQAGLIPTDLPPFLNGYQRGSNFWVNNQPSDYYCRHLVLHEGVHGFMRQFLGGVGAAWYSEGVAELLATHHWEFGNLLIGYVPKNKQEVPYWGRIKIIQDEFAASRGLMIREIMRLDTGAFLQNDAYAWCWAVAAFLDGHPVYRGKFRRMRNAAQRTGEPFTAAFERQVVGQLRELDEQWQLFVVNLDYGYDVARTAVKYATGLPVTSQGRDFQLQTNRGWQSSGIRLAAGQAYSIRTSGQFLVRQQPQPWKSEAGGITIEYVAGRPLGMLLGGLRRDEAQPGIATLNVPFPIGVARILKPQAGGTLYLRVNDAGAGYADNEGQLTVVVQPVSSESGGD